MTFGQKLKHWRKKAGLTQKELAVAAGINESYVSNLERDFSASTKSGTPRPSEALCHRLSIVLEVPEDDIRVAARHAPKSGKFRPRNIAEFIDTLESWGLEFGPTLADMDALQNYTEDDFEELLERIRRDVISDIEITIKRKNR